MGSVRQLHTFALARWPRLILTFTYGHVRPFVPSASTNQPRCACAAATAASAIEQGSPVFFGGEEKRSAPRECPYYRSRPTTTVGLTERHAARRWHVTCGPSRRIEPTAAATARQCSALPSPSSPGLDSRPFAFVFSSVRGRGPSVRPSVIGAERGILIYESLRSRRRDDASGEEREGA